MNQKMELQVVTEQNVSLAARLLLLINKKQIDVDFMNLNTNHQTKCHLYNLRLNGEKHMLQQVIKVIAKQIGVFEVKRSKVKSLKKEELVIA